MAVTTEHVDGVEDHELDFRALTEYLTVLDDGDVRARAANDLYTVTSQSGETYLVDPGLSACECKDNEMRDRDCKHIRRVRFATGRREIPNWINENAIDPQLGIHVDDAPDRGEGIETDGGVDPSEKGIDQFDLTLGMEFDISPSDIHELADRLSQAEAFDAESADDETLAEFAAALKELGDAAEDARKDVFEDELDERTDVDDEVGNLVKRQGHNKYLYDEDQAIEAIEQAGGDPTQAMSVKASDFVDVAEALGIDPDEHVGRAEYEYFRRQS